MLARTILFSVLAALAVATPTKNKKPTGLNDLAQKRGRYFGTATNSFNLNGSQPGGPYVEVLEREFAGALTPENEGKWESIHPSRDVYSFAGMDAVSEPVAGGRTSTLRAGADHH
jgi:endo-1,4-beta-xylanase